MHGSGRILGGLLAAVVAGGALGLVPASADATAGGASAVPASGEDGGAEYGAPLGPTGSPVASRFVVTPRSLTAGGRLPAVTLEIDEPGVPRVTARLVLWPVGGKGRSVDEALGSVPTGRVLHPRWPSNTKLSAGNWIARVHVTDPAGHPLSRPKRTPGLVSLSVRTASVAKLKPVAATTTAATTPAPTATPAPAGLLPGVFPVAGAHTYGDPFGAPRKGYTHQGQDVLAAEGTPIIAPGAGTVRITDYEAASAGEYIVLHLDAGPDLFFAHCVRHSTTVSAGQAVPIGTHLCDVGQTGDATGPHLHFELWPDGWRTGAANSVPVDPLPQLKAWEG